MLVASQVVWLDLPLWWQPLALLLLLIVGSVGPGLLVVRWLPWPPLEKLCAAVAASMVLLYLAAFAIYEFNLPWAAFYAVTALGVVGLVTSWRTLRTFWRCRPSRHAILGFAVLLIWTLLHLSLVRHYSGGMWSGDWIEHYMRAGFFLAHLPMDTVFIGLYLLPARPPMMNLVAGHFMAQVGTGFWHFQFVMTWLNTLVFLPCVLIAPRLNPAGRRPVGLILLAFLCNPMFMQNATYPWTRLLAASYVVLALHLYLRAWRSGDAVRMVSAFLCLAGGMLVHYSVAPFALFIGLHYVGYTLWRRRRPLREAAIATGLSAALFMTWVGWSVAHFGLRGTLATNTTVTDSARLSTAENLVKIASNLYYTILPHPVTVGYGTMARAYAQPSAAGFWRDYTFLIYQTNVLFIAGSVGALILLIALAWQWRQVPRASRWFWLLFVPFTVVVGVAVHGTLDRMGLAHICLQPLGLLAITAAAGMLPGAGVRVVVVAAWLVDYALGILLHFHVQNRVFEVDSQGVVHGSPLLLTKVAVAQWLHKAMRNWTFVGDLLASWRPAIQVAILLLLVAVIVSARYVDGRRIASSRLSERH